MRLGASSARLNFQKAIAWVGRVGKHAPKLEQFDLLAQGCGVGLDSDQRIVVVLRPGNIGKFARISQTRVDRLDSLNDLIELFFLPTEILCLLRVVPDVGGF